MLLRLLLLLAKLLTNISFIQMKHYKIKWCDSNNIVQVDSVGSKINTVPVGSKYLSIIKLTKWCIFVHRVCMCPVILEVVRQIVKSIQLVLLTSLSSAAPGWCWPAAQRHRGTSWSWSQALPLHASYPWPRLQISFPLSEVCPPVLVETKYY